MICEEINERDSQPSIAIHNWSYTKPKSPAKIKKKISRVSLVLDKSFNQSNDHRKKENIFTISGDFSNQIVYITVNLVVGNGIKPISFVMGNSLKMDLIIPKAIALFNDAFKQERALFLLKENNALYALKPCKKTGFPKVDMPNMNLQTSLVQSTFTQFALVLNSNPEDYYSYFEKVKTKPKNNCDRCSII